MATDITDITDRPRSTPAPPPHRPTDHAPVIYPWRTDLGIGLNPDMNDVGRLHRAVKEWCEDCVYHWADRVAEGDAAPILHFLSSAWTRAVLHDIPWRSVFVSDASQRIIVPMVRREVKKALRITEETGYDDRKAVLDDATAIMGASLGELLQTAEECARQMGYTAA